MILSETPSAPGGGIPLAHNHRGTLAIPNLLNDFAGLATLLAGELGAGSWLNAYLLAAGMNQIMEDYLHRDPYALDRAAKHLSRLRKPVGPPAARGAQAIGTVMWHVREARTVRLLRWQQDLAALVQRLADAVVSSASLTPAQRDELRAAGGPLLALVRTFPVQVRHDVLRLPSCFRSFDQQPADLERLVEGFAQRWPDRALPLVVVGVRTSGSYLAPLHAAYLKAYGYQNVQALTMRPGRRMLASERAALQAMIRAGGLALLTDDPPSSGSSLDKAAHELERCGVPSQAIVLLLQLFGTCSALPSVLQAYASVLLPWEQWTIHEKLSPASVQSALADLLHPTLTVDSVEQFPLSARAWERGHIRARYRAHLVDPHNGARSVQDIYVKGVGLGYFGEHALAVAQGLGAFLPRVYGVRAGLVFRAWLPQEQQLDGQVSNRETAVAAYVTARGRALAVPDDVSMRLVNRDPIWQRASDLFGQAFGRAAPLVRPVLHRTAKHLLHVAHPSVIDGSMAPSRWFAAEIASGPLKVDADEHAFCNRDMYCYDPIFDLAGAAVSEESSATSGRLRQAYEGLTGIAIDEERWLLYQVLHLQEVQRRLGGEEPRVQRALSRVYQRYMAEVFFKDVTLPQSGQLCAIDIDGVLETEALGFPAITPAGAVTLRALTQHGYWPILVTGRSLDDVRERCAAYGLSGGVAEYGAVVYDHRTGRVRRLLSEQERGDLNRLRVALSEIDGVYLDADYGEAARAYCLDHHGRRRGLSAETIAMALTISDTQDRLRPILGVRQTDFMAVGIDKGSGVRALAEFIGPIVPGADGNVLACAVGDTVSDLPMFKLATLSGAPANADDGVRAAHIGMMKRPYQAGLALAASRLLGHRPGGCPVCRAPRLSVGAELLLTALAAQDTGKWGKLTHALRLHMRLR